jgi:hypothetical protein
LKVVKAAAVSLLVILLWAIPFSRNTRGLYSRGSTVTVFYHLKNGSIAGNDLVIYAPEDPLPLGVKKTELPESILSMDGRTPYWPLYTCYTVAVAEVEVTEVVDYIKPDEWRGKQPIRLPKALAQCTVRRVLAQREGSAIRPGGDFIVYLPAGSCHIANFGYRQPIKKGNRYVLFLVPIMGAYVWGDAQYESVTDRFFTIPVEVSPEGREQMDLTAFAKFYQLDVGECEGWNMDQLSFFLTEKFREYPLMPYRPSGIAAKEAKK